MKRLHYCFFVKTCYTVLKNSRIYDIIKYKDKLKTDSDEMVQTIVCSENEIGTYLN